MTEKRFKMKKLEYESYFIDSQQEYVDEDEPNFKINGEKTMSDSQILDLLNENEQLRKDATTLICANQDCRHENEQLKSENKRLTDKLNEIALEFLNYDMVTMGKATEISEMCYSDFLKYRKEHGNPMELQE